MDHPTAPEAFYEKYWALGGLVYSGARQGYADNFRRWLQAELRELPRTAAVLDVGCGDATFTTLLAGCSDRVTAVDLSAGQLARNAHHLPQVTFLQHDLAQPLPFAAETFAVVWCSEVLEHLFDPALAVREMHRVLAPGGRLLVTVPYHGRLKDVLIALFKWDEHFSPSNPHIRFFTRRTLAGVVREAGFRRIRLGTCGLNRPLRDLIVPTNLLLHAEKD